MAARPPELEPGLEPSPEPGGGAGDGPGGAAVAPRVAAGQLTSFAAAVLAATGVPDGDARLVADSLVRADLWGHQSHGVLRLPWYVRRIRAGVMQAVTDPELVVDVLAGVLTGSASGQAVHGPYQSEHRSGCGHLFVALDVGTFLPLAEFGARMERLVDQLKAVPRAEGVAEILYPGELEDRSEARNRREGLELPDQTLANLARLGRETGVEFGPAAGPGAVGAR